LFSHQISVIGQMSKTKYPIFENKKFRSIIITGNRRSYYTIDIITIILCLIQTQHIFIFIITKLERVLPTLIDKWILYHTLIIHLQQISRQLHLQSTSEREVGCLYWENKKRLDFIL